MNESSFISPSGLAWQRFRKNPVSLVSLIAIVVLVILALGGYWIIPDKTPNANTQFLELAGEKPGFKVKMLKVRKNQDIQKQGVFPTLIHGRTALYQQYPMIQYSFKEDSIVIMEYTDFPELESFPRSFHVADVVFPVDGLISSSMDGILNVPLKGGIEEYSSDELKKLIVEENIITRTFILGTDRFGRDLYSRIILGARVSMSVGFIAVIISLIIGVFLGSIAGYYPGVIDNMIMWLINVVWSIPTLLLVIALTMVLGKGFWQIFIAVGLTMWVEVARVVRGQVMALRKREFIDAARVSGLSDLRIIFRHILPNTFSPVIIIAASNFASAILIEAGLSFLGIGVQPPVPSWGTMIRDHYGYIIVDKAYLAFIPGFAIMLVVLAFTLAGNGLRDAFDVKAS